MLPGPYSGPYFLTFSPGPLSVRIITTQPLVSLKHFPTAALHSNKQLCKMNACREKKKKKKVLLRGNFVLNDGVERKRKRKDSTPFCCVYSSRIEKIA